MTRRRPIRLGLDWRAASLQVEGTAHFLGRWDTAEEAAIARERAMLHFGVKERGMVRGRALRLGAASPEELRLASRRARRRAAGKSPFEGVSFDRKRRAFCAKISHKGKAATIGYFDAESEAALAVDRVSVHLGLPARNFPCGDVRATSLEELRHELRDSPRTSLRKSETLSPFAGVVHARDNPGRPWVVSFFSAATGVHKCVASFESERDAALAHDRLALHYHARPVLNFPSRARSLGPATIEMIGAEASHERKKQTTSAYRGVHRTQSGRWAATIMHESNVHALGLYDVETAAARAYDDAARRLKGEKARLNFPSRYRAAGPGAPPRSAPASRAKRNRGWAKRRRAKSARTPANSWSTRFAKFVAKAPAVREHHHGDRQNRKKTA